MKYPSLVKQNRLRSLTLGRIFIKLKWTGINRISHTAHKSYDISDKTKIHVKFTQTPSWLTFRLCTSIKSPHLLGLHTVIPGFYSHQSTNLTVSPKNIIAITLHHTKSPISITWLSDFRSFF